MIEVDPDEDDAHKLVKESSSEADEVIMDGFELCKRGHDEGTSTSDVTGKDPPEEAR